MVSVSPVSSVFHQQYHCRAQTHPRHFWESNELYHISCRATSLVDWAAPRPIKHPKWPCHSWLPYHFPAYLWQDMYTICYVGLLHNLVLTVFYSWTYCFLTMVFPRSISIWMSWIVSVEEERHCYFERRDWSSCGFGRIPWLYLVADAQEKKTWLNSQMQ